MVRTGIGIDIGCRNIKIVRTKLRKNKIQLMDYGSAPTPEGAVESGNITNTDQVGEAIAKLAQELRLKNKPAVAAVSGPQVYIRTLAMPRMKLKELREAVRYEASVFLPIPVSEVVMDVYPLRQYRDGERVKVDLFFTAVRRNQVSAIWEVCHRGGFKLQAIDLEPLAIKRLFQSSAHIDPCGFLHIGAFRTCFSVFDKGALVFHRYLPFEDRKQGRMIEWTEGTGLLYSGPDKTDRLIQNIAIELIRSLEYFTLQKKKEVAQIIITGGGACMPRLERFIQTEVKCPVEIGDTLSQLELPERVNQEETRRLLSDFTIAIGLAARGNR